MNAECIASPADVATRAGAMTPLVIRFGRVGDMVLQAPLLQSLHLRYGLPCRLITAGSWSSALFAGSPHVGAITALRSRHRPFLLSPDRWKLVATLKQHEGPIYVSEDVERQVTRVRRLLRYARVAPERCVFLEDMPPADDHVVDRLLRFAARTPSAWSPAGYPPSAGRILPIPTLGAGPEDRADGDSWLEQRGWRGRPVVLLQAGSKHAIKWGRQRDTAKAWPADRWVELIGMLSARLPRAVFMLCGSANERRFLETLRDRCSTHGATVAVVDFPLRRLMSLMRIAHSMVSVDTGPAHIAAALACPIVVIYGNEPQRVWSRRSAVPGTVVELGGTPDRARADAIPASAVHDAWLALAHRT